MNDMNEAAYDAQTLNAKLERWKKEGSHYKPYALCYRLIAERDRLAAENAELRESAAFYGNKFSHDIEQADRRLSQWKSCFRLAFGLKQKYFSDLAAANATLDALRELCGPSRTISTSTCMKMVDLLYPPSTPTQPEEKSECERNTP